MTEDRQRIERLREEMAGALIVQFLEGIDRLGISRKEAIEMISQKEG